MTTQLEEIRSHELAAMFCRRLATVPAEKLVGLFWEAYEKISVWAIFGAAAARLFTELARVVPNEVLTRYTLLEREVRWGKMRAEDIEAVRNEALDHLVDLRRIPLEVLREYPFEVRCRLLRRIQAAHDRSEYRVRAQLAMLTAIEAGTVAGKALFQEIAHLHEEIRADVLYNLAHTLGVAIPRWLEVHLLTRLNAEGFIIGVLEKGMHQGRKQFQVWYGDKLYVERIWDWPKWFIRPIEEVGDRVIIRKESGWHLGWRGGCEILASWYLPADKAFGDDWNGYVPPKALWLYYS